MRISTNNLDQLRKKLSELNLFDKEVNEQIEHAIRLVKLETISIEKEIDHRGFATPEEEIFFFRHVKPPLYSMLIAFTKLRKLELLRSSFDKIKFKVVIKKKLDFVQAHYLDYPEFIRYFNSTSTHDDERYFLRSNKIQLDCFPNIYDDRLSTGYDLIAAHLLAYQFLTDHFDQSDRKAENESNYSNVPWTADKVAFVELISGLHAVSSINKGDIDLKTLCAQLGSLFNIEIKDVYGKRNEIKERKGERFKFIRQMLDALERDFDENFE